MSAELNGLLDDIAGPGFDGWDDRFAGLADRVRSAELDAVGHPESSGGAGGSTYDAATVVMRVAQAGGDLCLTERLLVAAHVAGAAGFRVRPATVAVAVAEGPTGEAAVRGVAGLRDAEQLLLVVPGPPGLKVILLEPGSWTFEPGENVAGEPRDLLLATPSLGVSRKAPPELAEAAQLLGALGRACQIAGAMRAVLDLTVRYTAERRQFGRPLLAQQLVQQHLVTIAVQVAATEAAVAAVFDESPQLSDPTAPGTTLAISAAKLQASTAAVVAARHAHQATGAMGLAAEYPLGHLTRRLWAWAEEYGSSRFWAGRLGAAVTAQPDLWSLVGPTAVASTP